MPQHLDTPQGRRIAYERSDGAGPGIVFLGGFRSDMTGTKALHLDAWARARGRAFLRFDYSGHGQSSGRFEDGAIGDWAEDAAAAIDMMDGPLVLVGSSMGGWISLLLARARPERVHALVTIAAAPDFTEDGFWASFPQPVRDRLMTSGAVEVPSDYEAPYTITRRLIEEGRDHLVLREPLHLPMPTRMLQGTADDAVPTSTATRLLDHATGPDIRLTLVKDSDHPFSGPRDLALITAAIEDVS